MDYFKSVRRAVSFMEENLKEALCLDDVARAACFSRFHFQRIFQAFVGESASEYIRKRRLTMASLELLESNVSILDIAIAYRFDSQASFTRAFKRMFGTTPAKYRSQKVRCRFFEKRELTESKIEHLNGGMTVNPHIINKESFKLVGLSCFAGLESKENIPRLWLDFLARKGEIRAALPGTGYYGICQMDELADLSSYDALSCFNEDTKVSYFVGLEVGEFREIPPGMEVREIPAQLYAVFTHRGILAAMNRTFDHIYGTWLPKTDYEVTWTLNLEHYDERCTGPDDPASEMDIYLPVKPKGEVSYPAAIGK